MTGYPTILPASAELPSVAGMVENRPFDMSVEMLSPASAAEVRAADAGRYNAGTVLPPGASDVQSIRAAQTADLRAKQTRPSDPARRSARVNTRSGDGDSPGSMTAGRFHSEKCWRVFWANPLWLALLRSLTARGLRRGGGGNLRCPPEPAPAKAGGLKNAIAAVFAVASWQRCRTHSMATAAAIDRGIHHSVILEFDVPSYRTNAAQQRVQPRR